MSAESYGLMADFATPEALLAAIRHLREAGYQRLEAYTPIPIEGLEAALDLPADRLPWLMLMGGLAGGGLAFGGQAWSAMRYFPLNVGGRPNFSWPAFVPITFELTVLGAAVAGLFGMLWLNGLPRLHHPVFGARRFELASRDRFFLCVRSTDDGFDWERARQDLARLGALEVNDVPA